MAPTLNLSSGVPRAGFRLSFWLGFIVFGLLGTAHAAAPVFPLAALAPGQRGYALTAVAGNRIERFNVEVLALQYDAGSGFPLVLVRSSGPVIDAAGGIASGMSGSPVYLTYRGKVALLGAISFTFPNSSGGLGLVTPISTMRRTPPRANLGNSSSSVSSNDILKNHVAKSHVAAFGPQLDLGRAVPVRTPLLILGVSARAGAFLEPLLAASEPLTLPGTGGNPNTYARQDEAFTLQPGSAISVQLVRGDVTVAAIGTLTLIEGGEFWAFGHPLLGGGPVSLALAPAYVTALVPSRSTPFKLADSGRRVLGSVTQDRPYGISGVVGKPPEFIPVSLHFSGDAGALQKRFEVANDEHLYAPLLASATLQAFDELLAARRGGTAALAWDIALKGGRRVRILEQTTSPDDVAFAAAGLAAEPLGLLAANPFRAAEVTRVAISIGFEKVERAADLVEVVPERTHLEVGGALFLNVRLQPYRDNPVVEQVKVRLPANLRGPVTLRVRGGATLAGGANKLRPLRSFAELLNAVEDNVQASELVVEATIGGEARLLARLSLPYLVSGNESVELKLRGPKPSAPPSKPDGTPKTPLDKTPALPQTNPRKDPLEENPPLEPSVNLGFHTMLERP